jgi:hypothetical protein
MRDAPSSQQLDECECSNFRSGDNKSAVEPNNRTKVLWVELYLAEPVCQADTEVCELFVPSDSPFAVGA